jgi:hypothetical protein
MPSPFTFTNLTKHQNTSKKTCSFSASLKKEAHCILQESELVECIAWFHSTPSGKLRGKYFKTHYGTFLHIHAIPQITIIFHILSTLVPDKSSWNNQISYDRRQVIALFYDTENAAQHWKWVSFPHTTWHSTEDINFMFVSITVRIVTQPIARKKRLNNKHTDTNKSSVWVTTDSKTFAAH